MPIQIHPPRTPPTPATLHLMPFHIGHTGPAPISTYFKPKEVEGLVGAGEVGGAGELGGGGESKEEEEEGGKKEEEEKGKKQTKTKIRRFIAAFRGRSIHGLKVDVPEGYAGIVLSSPSSHTSIQNQHPNPSQPRPRTQARLTKPAEDAMQVDGDEVNKEDPEEENEEAPPKPLTPTSTFTSFTLWNPDIPVDEGTDEYVRALREWCWLSGEIHRVD